MTSLPPRAASYLVHAIAPTARTVEAIEVQLAGRLKLGGSWYAFDSTLDIGALSRFHWRARLRRGLVRFSGHDLYEAGHGEMLWRLYGLLPVVRADSADVTRSARGRAALEQIFMPSALARPEVAWSETDDGWMRAGWTLDGEDVAIDLDVAPEGALRAVRMQRWSDAAGEPWRRIPFGADVLREETHAGLTIPAEVTAGWFYGEAGWEEGRFFEARVEGVRVGEMARMAG